MKKQNVKKLALSKETVRSLEASVMRDKVVGGRTLDDCNPDTYWSCEGWCVEGTSGC